MDYSKIKEYLNQEKTSKMKEIAKRHHEGDQGSASEKRKIKCSGKGHKNVFEDHLTEPNECSKGYQMYRKIHILDLLNRFKDPTEARMRISISWNELSEAKLSHLEHMLEENEKLSICLHSPSSNRMVFCDVCGTWYHSECKGLDHIFAHNTAVYVCHLCIKKPFSDILQYLYYNIDCFLNNNSGNLVVALL